QDFFYESSFKRDQDFFYESSFKRDQDFFYESSFKRDQDFFYESSFSANVYRTYPVYVEVLILLICFRVLTNKKK
ncbi:MAG: hypothetical protein ABIB79_01250, partial [archaeon]